MEEIIFPDEIRALAQRYIWWKTPDEALRFPLRVVAQIMELGVAKDCALMKEYFGREKMVQALREAEPGWFSPRSWNFWHYRLGITKIGEEVPPLPIRQFA
jgi:hypothetical protein